MVPLYYPLLVPVQPLYSPYITLYCPENPLQSVFAGIYSCGIGFEGIGLCIQDLVFWIQGLGCKVVGFKVGFGAKVND